MTLVLNLGTKPENLEVKSVSPGLGAEVFGGEGIHIGEYTLTMEDFFVMVRYVLTNTNIDGENDPRMKFVGDVRGAVTTEGFPDLTDGKATQGLRRLILPGFRTISGH